MWLYRRPTLSATRVNLRARRRPSIPSSPSRRAGSLAWSGPYKVIHLGGQAAVIIPLAEFLRLRAPESTASAQALEDAEDAAAAQDWLAREARGETNDVPLPEVRRRLASRAEPRTEPPTACAHLSRQVPLDEKAVHQATAFLADDPDGLRRRPRPRSTHSASTPAPTTPCRSAPPDCTGYASAGTGCSTR